MNKKIFLSIVLALAFVCLFAMGALAKDVYLEEIPDELKVGESDTITHFVVFEEEKYFTASGSTISALNTSVMSEDMASAGIDETKIGTEYLTRFNFPSHMGGTLITYVNLNSIKSDLYFSKGGNGVCGYIQLAGTVNKVHDMNQRTQQLRCIDFGENSQITEIPYCFAAYSTKLMSVKNFPKNLTTVGGEAFNNCYGAFRGELYINAQTIGSNAFNNAISNVTRLVFGPNLKSIANQALCVRLAEITAFYKPDDGKVAIEYLEFQCDVTQVSFAQQGNDKGSLYFIGGNARSPYSKLSEIILSHPNNASKIVEGTTVFNDFTAEGVTILLNDSDGLDDYVYASHKMTAANSCFGVCERCGLEKMLDNPEHQYGAYVYQTEDGEAILYTDDIYVYSECSVCQTNLLVEKIDKIFTALGYSSEEGEDSSMLIHRVKVNHDSLEKYQDMSADVVKYGVAVAIANEKKTDSLITVDENGSIAYTQGAIVMNFTDAKYSNVEIILMGINKNVNIYCSAYIVGNYGVRYISGADEGEYAIAQSIVRE
ncbi:MAG: hypothetical protein E7602_07325 [Ruminococcaceae bacterium]|nr:hypothetical protein [Oscillospiraceae bacterium]